MPKIILRGVEPETLAMKTDDKAFTRPEEGANLSWIHETKFNVYNPFLIKASSLSDDKRTLQFRGVDLLNRKEFGKANDTDDGDDYVVDLYNDKHAYRHKPSTLDELEPGGEKAYAILFLSEEFLKTRDSANKLALRAQGGPKYPPVSSDYYEVKRKVEILTAKLQKANDLLRSHASTNKSLSAEHIRQLIEELAP